MTTDLSNRLPETAEAMPMPWMLVLVGWAWLAAFALFVTA